jgi:2-polyprenyl-6-methoxyphenol hydroxylase-like FAD-dependent oxidoreductase
VVIYNAPGRAIAIHPACGQSIAAFMFRRAAVPGFDHRDIDLHKRLVAEAYTGRLGVFAELLEHLLAAEDFYFDSVSRVRLPHWSSGRVTLLGDTASCVSLFGDGSTLAIAGAYTLAEELARTPEDVVAALARYEQRHRRLVDPKQRGTWAAAAFLIPATRTGIAMRNTVTRLLP